MTNSADPQQTNMRYTIRNKATICAIVFISFYCLLEVTFTPQGTTTNEKLRTIERDLSDKNFSQPWPNNKECSRFLTRFGKSLPLTYLASYPRSGNTWIRYLIEGATGIYTGSVYYDDRLQQKFPGEKDDWSEGRVVVVKIHPKAFKGSFTMEPLTKTPVILLLRNPYQSIASLWDFNLASRTGRRKDAFQFASNRSSFKTTAFKRHVSLQLRIWEGSTKGIISMSQKLHVVFYERLKKDPINELRKILKFLHLNVDENRLDCTYKHLEGKAKRKHKEDVIPYDKRQEIELTKAIANVAGLLKLRGIEVPKEYKILILSRTYLRP